MSSCPYYINPTVLHGRVKRTLIPLRLVHRVAVDGDPLQFPKALHILATMFALSKITGEGRAPIHRGTSHQLGFEFAIYSQIFTLQYKHKWLWQFLFWWEKNVNFNWREEISVVAISCQTNSAETSSSFDNFSFILVSCTGGNPTDMTCLAVIQLLNPICLFRFPRASQHFTIYLQNSKP